MPYRLLHWPPHWQTRFFTPILVKSVQPLLDQACAALVCYKLHRLTITLPVNSLAFWTYLPSCLLADVIVIALLQYACGKVLYASDDGEGAAAVAISQRRQSYGFLLDEAEEASLMPHKSKSTSPTRRPRKTSLALILALIVTSLILVGFTVLAIGSFEAGDVVITWKDALSFEASGRSEFLIKSAMESWYCFAAALASIISTAWFFRWLAFTIEGYRMKNGEAAHQRTTVLAARCMFGVYVLLALWFPPPRLLNSSNLLWDGVKTATIMGLTNLGVISNLGPHVESNSELFGRSNIYEPRLTPMGDIKHVFVVSMESADGLAWPYSPKYCENRNCMDIPSEYNTVEHITPFFNSLIQKDNVFFTSEYKASIAYTTKSHFALACGQSPDYTNWVEEEWEVLPPLPCLPQVLRAADPSFRSSHFASQSFTWDHYGESVDMNGYDLRFGRDQMEDDWHRRQEGWLIKTNHFGYSEAQALPYLWDYVDQNTVNNSRLFMFIPGNVMHHPFDLPAPDEDPFKPITYSERSTDVSKYLNCVRWTDGYLQEFFEGLEKRGLLENSLVIVAGDHGPRIDSNGIFHTTTMWHDSGIFQVPLLIHAPQMALKKQPRQQFVSLDIMPTILDALGMSPEIISKYPGHSILRNRGPDYDRVTFHSQNPGGNARQVTRKSADYHFKAVYFDDSGDTCGTDLNIDSTEELLYCEKTGWRQTNVNGKIEDGLSLGLWKAGSTEEKALIEWVHEATTLLQQLFVTNDAIWNVTKVDERAAAQDEFLTYISTHARLDQEK